MAKKKEERYLSEKSGRPIQYQATRRIFSVTVWLWPQFPSTVCSSENWELDQRKLIQLQNSFMKRCIRAGRLLSAPSRTPGISLSSPSTCSLSEPQQAGNLKIGCEFRRLYLTLKGEFTYKHLTTHFLAYREPNVPSFRAQASIFWWDRKHRIEFCLCNAIMTAVTVFTVIW